MKASAGKSVIPAKIVKFPILDKRNAVRYLNGIFVHLLKMLHFSSINRSCPAFSTFPAVITHSFSLQCHNDSAVARIYGCNASRIRDHYLTEVCPFTHDLFHVLSTFRVITVCDHQTFAAVSPPSLHAISAIRSSARVMPRA